MAKKVSRVLICEVELEDGERFEDKLDAYRDAAAGSDSGAGVTLYHATADDLFAVLGGTPNPPYLPEFSATT